MKTDRQVVIDSLGVAAAVGVSGVSFGALATASGFTIGQAMFLSLLLFSGASQFALIGVLGGGGSAISAAATALLLSTRNMFYGIALAPILKLGPLQRTLSAHLVIDESTAMAVVRTNERHARLAFYVTGFAIFILWNISSFLGAVAGVSLGDPRVFGLDAAVPAVFLALIWPRLTSHRLRALATLAALLALAVVPLVPVGLPIIIAGGVTVLLGLAWGKQP